MANTYTLIASNTLTTSAASVTFSAIPNTYTDLVLRMSTRGAVSAQGTGPIYFRLSGDISTNYSVTDLKGNGSSASSSRQSSFNFGDAGESVWVSWTADTFANTEIYIPNYTVSQNKPISVFAAVENNATSAVIETQAVLWRNNTSISSIELSQFTFAAGSSFFLYGIKSS